jgi:transcriptional regulator with XRE-family HTH domain
MAMELSFGARLRAQRERQQVELTAIAEETKISVALLEGLERDDVSRWPSGLFRRAYIRAYALKIGLDPEQVVRDFLDQYPDPVHDASPIEAIAEATGGRRPKTRLGLMIAGLAGLRPQKTATTQAVARPEIAVHEPPSELPVEHVAAELTESSPVESQPFFELESATPSAGLLKVPAIEPAFEPLTVEARPDSHAVEHSVWSTARLCTRVACARDDRDLSAALEEVSAILDAQGVILWVWDRARAALCAVLSYGYPDELLTRLPEVRRSSDNAIATAFRFGQSRVVRGGGTDETGAFVAPLMTPDGCVGVLALEFADGGEQSDFAQALTTIVSAQFATLFAATPQVDIEEEWRQRNHSLVAS